MRPYDLRHSIATALRRAGADLADVQAFLGHGSPRMTQRYALRRGEVEEGREPDPVSYQW